MKIFDLTRGKYSKVYFQEGESNYVELVERMSHFSSKAAIIMCLKCIVRSPLKACYLHCSLMSRAPRLW